jgi:signal transduction histidine kinase
VNSLYLRIYATVVVVLALFAFGSTFIVREYVDTERQRTLDVAARDRLAAWGELLERSLPRASETPETQALALLDWSNRMRLPLSLRDAQGKPIAASDSFQRLQRQGIEPMLWQMSDGRTLAAYRPGLLRRLEGGNPLPRRGPNGEVSEARGAASGTSVQPAEPPWSLLPPWLPRGTGLLAVLVALFIAVAAGAWPVVRRLTRRLEALKRGVEQFGAGELGHRVAVQGDDEVAAVAASFNTAAARVEALVQSHRSLLANASHELRSPLTRMKMAVSLLEHADDPEDRERLKAEIDANVAELDSLVEEVLLASRLDAARDPLVRQPFDLVALVAEEASRVGAPVEAPDGAGDRVAVSGDERLIRRAVRNLLENARRYGGGDVEARIARAAEQGDRRELEVQVLDRGPGVPAEFRERIFEPFYRLPAMPSRPAASASGSRWCGRSRSAMAAASGSRPGKGGGSRFTLALPAA